MKTKPAADVCRHLSLASVGGFFASYAVLITGHMAIAQTSNLIELVLSALRQRWQMAAMTLGCLLVYLAGLSLPILLRRFSHIKPEILSPLISAAACVSIIFTGQAPFPLGLYPLFFAASVQWNTFSGAQGFTSATVFSTNNARQTLTGLLEYLCSGDKAHLKRFRLFGATLLCFHTGAVAAFFAVQMWDRYGILVNLVLIANALVMILREENLKAANIT